jgi:hypothetical protein
VIAIAQFFTLVRKSRLAIQCRVREPDSWPAAIPGGG